MKRKEVLNNEQDNTEDILRGRVGELEIEITHYQNRIDNLQKQVEAQKRTIETLLNVLGTNEKLDKNIEDYLTRQKRIFDNKVKHGFNTTNIYQEARYILEEVAELMRAIEKNDRENMIEELADIVIFAYGCTEVARLGDLDTKIFEKMKLNESRVYKQTEAGDFVKVESTNNMRN